MVSEGLLGVLCSILDFLDGGSSSLAQRVCPAGRQRVLASLLLHSACVKAWGLLQDLSVDVQLTKLVDILLKM